MAIRESARLSPIGVDWQDVKDWDEKYYLRPFRALGEYTHVGVERGEGSYLYLADGSRVLDFMSQYVCANLGQGHPRVRAAIVEAAGRFTYLSEPWTSDYRSKAAKLIVEDLLGDEGWAGQVRFVTTGTEAIEMALIMAKLFTGRPNIVSQEFSYHGWTPGAAGASLRLTRGNVAHPGTGEVLEVPNHVPPGYYLAPAPNPYPGEEPRDADGTLACVRQTEELFQRIGAETVAAFVVDVSHGTGSIHPPPEYLPQIRALTERYGALLIDDEVLSGFGRMGKWFAYQNYPGVRPDIMAIGKGLVAAAAPAAGVVVRSDIGEFFKDRRWWLPTTMAGHPLAMAAVCATIEAMLEEGIVERAAETGEYLAGLLAELEARHPSVGLVSGAGMFRTVELVKNKETRELFVPEDRNSMGEGDVASWPVNVVARHGLERGVYMSGFVPNTLRLGPPLTASREECDEAMEALDYALSRLDEGCTR